MSAQAPSEATVFCEALECPTPEARAAYLRRACRGDADLRSRVEALLRVHEDNGDFLASPAAILADPTLEARPEPAAEPDAIEQRVGPYRLLERLGEGGFGSVYLAEQSEPIRRNVALKIIKAGMNTRQVIARFEAERRALALMDHPNIARVLDAGEQRFEHGGVLPYFAMELVRGEPITAFCDRQRQSVPERLRLFIDVCHAVQHAHQKGVIHRDLKPSNVLVTLHDGRPLPKVIDFGIAKALDASIGDETAHTEARQFIGTPEYMSPEQAALDAHDIDTRSDVYSLGVLLYELLAGMTPFDRAALRAASFDELRRIIREVEPPKPSTRLSQSTASLPTLAGLRRVEPHRLTKLMRGELDWIVMKCLEKDRTRRYQTANALADDVLSSLVGKPVLAAPPSAAYRLRKYLRRHRTIAAVSATLVIGLSAGLAGTTYGLIQTQKVHAEKERMWATIIDKYRNDYHNRRTFLTLSSPYTLESLGVYTWALESLRRHAEAEAELRDFLALQEQSLRRDKPALLATLRSLARNLSRQGRFAEAEAVSRDALERCEGGQVKPYFKIVCQLNFADILVAQHKYAEAEALTLDALSSSTDDARNQWQAVMTIIRLYKAWDAAEPGRGLAEKASEWRAQLGRLQKRVTDNASAPADASLVEMEP